MVYGPQVVQVGYMCDDEGNDVLHTYTAERRDLLGCTMNIPVDQEIYQGQTGGKF